MLAQELLREEIGWALVVLVERADAEIGDVRPGIVDALPTSLTP